MHNCKHCDHDTEIAANFAACPAPVLRDGQVVACGCTRCGEPKRRNMTIAELREETRRYADTDEVFVNGLPVLQLSLQAGAIDGRPVAAIEIVTEPE